MTKLEILLDDGKKILVEVEDYDAKTLAVAINKTGENMIAIGDCVLQKFSIVRVVPQGSDITQ